MAKYATPRLRHRQLSMANIVLSLVIGAVLVVGTPEVVGRHVESELQGVAEETFAIRAGSLRDVLDKYRLLPVLLSRRPDVIWTFAGLDADTDAARRIATEAAGLSGALEVALIKPDGSYLARGLNVIKDSIAPESSLFTAAMQGRLGRQVRVLENGKRTYVFTSGVRVSGQISGVVAVYVSLGELEANWTLDADPIAALDESGRIVMSNVPEWRLKSINDISRRVNGQRQFVIDSKVHDYLETNQVLTSLGLRLCVLVDRSSVFAARTFWGIFAGLVCLVLSLAAQAAINRYTIFVRRERRDRATALRLERRVRDRTRELVQSNERLANEVEERRTAEELLRKTQDELVQSGKLAALGQMSASLAHELNQPLSAVKSYADNALTFLERDRISDASDNLTSISRLADRMAGIARHLKNFARKPNTHPTAVDVGSVVSDALAVLDGRIRADKAKVSVSQPKKPIIATAGEVRLQQVVINLVLNALDAVCELERRAIVDIDIYRKDGQVFVTVGDNGPGISAEHIGNIFDPFFTAKPVGQGLGLGLSISYNIIKDFNGHLSATNRTDGDGAIFTVTLGEAQKVKAAAE